MILPPPNLWRTAKPTMQNTSEDISRQASGHKLNLSSQSKYPRCDTQSSLSPRNQSSLTRWLPTFKVIPPLSISIPQRSSTVFPPIHNAASEPSPEQEPDESCGRAHGHAQGPRRRARGKEERRGSRMGYKM